MVLFVAERESLACRVCSNNTNSSKEEFPLVVSLWKVVCAFLASLNDTIVLAVLELSIQYYIEELSPSLSCRPLS